MREAGQAGRDNRSITIANYLEETSTGLISSTNIMNVRQCSAKEANAIVAQMDKGQKDCFRRCI